MDGGCQQSSPGPSRLPQIRERASTPAKDIGSLGNDDPMRDATLDQPRASRGPKPCLPQLYLQQAADAAAAGDNVPWQTL